MTIYELADLLNVTILVHRHPNQDNRWTASFDGCETKDSEYSNILAGTYGNGNAPAAALDDYARQIGGKVLVFNAMSDRRREFVAPKGLEV